MRIVETTTDCLTLRVLFDSPEIVWNIDPARIKWDFEYELLQALHGTLTEWSPDGSIGPALAESYEWINDHEAKLKIRTGVKTVDGIPLTPEDVEFSLKRVIIINKNPHGNLADLICGGREISSAFENCPGLRVEGDSIIFRTEGKKAFLFQVLTSLDFAILPRASVDPDSLEIRDRRNTFGPYYLESANNGEPVALSANHGFHGYHDLMPQKLILVPPTKEETNGKTLSPQEMFRQKMVDHISTSFAGGNYQIAKIAENDPEARLHATMGLSVGCATFTEKGRRELGVQRRLKIAKAIHDAVKDDLSKKGNGASFTDTLIPAFAMGALTHEQSEKMREIFGSLPGDENGAGLRVAIPEPVSRLSRLPLKRNCRGRSGYPGTISGFQETETESRHRLRLLIST